MTARVHAPELEGAGGWINTASPLTLAHLRGRVVLLDFWTFCCINCLRVIEELRPVEERFGDRLVVIGVHSPKFPHESDHAAVERAVKRHRITHPVLDDPDMLTWQRYGVRAWPTFVVIDPDGYVVAQAAGEGGAATLVGVIEAALEGREVPAGAAFEPVLDTERHQLSFPGKVASDGAGRIAIADTGNDRVLVCDLSGTVIRVLDGFQQPQGVRFDGERLLVCDTVAGRVVAVPLGGGDETTLVDGVRSPWDIAILPDGRIAVAEAGLHRLLAIPPTGGAPTVLAGTRAEGLRDGPADLAHLAQPSGLAVLTDGSLAIADSEVSALRLLRQNRVETLAGSGLFEWGDDDGGRDTARLQHPLGVAALPDGGIAVADTFNGRIRVYRDGQLRGIAVDRDLAEPGGLDVVPDGRLIVADTNNHRILLIDAASGVSQELRVAGPDEAEESGSGPAIAGAPGTAIRLALPELDLNGEALDPAQGPPVRLSVSADPPELLGPGPRAWALDDLAAEVTLVLGRPGEGKVSLDVVAATCRGDVCTVHRGRLQRTLTVHSSV